MKEVLFYTFLLLASCNKDERRFQKKTDSISKVPVKKEIKEKGDSQKSFGLTHNIDKDTIWYKPVRYYLENKKCNPVAKDFYFGEYEPWDEPKTAELLSLSSTNDTNLRPFYRWILNKTIMIEDGALGEYTGVPARKYAEKFPKEFFAYMDYDTTGNKYSAWVSSILYSGFYDMDDWQKPKEIRKRMIKTMMNNYKNCNIEAQKRIKEFANECFQDNNYIKKSP